MLLLKVATPLKKNSEKKGNISNIQNKNTHSKKRFNKSIQQCKQHQQKCQKKQRQTFKETNNEKKTLKFKTKCKKFKEKK